MSEDLDASHLNRDEPVDDVLELDAEDDGSADDVMLLQEVDGALELPIWEPTGEPRVDDALELLSALDTEDVAGHAEVYGQIHQRLRQTLADADAASL